MTGSMKNNIWLGLLLGLIFPLLAFVLSRYTSLTDLLPAGKEGVPYIVAAAVNLIAVRFLYRRKPQMDNVAKGVMLITFLAMLAFLYTQKISI